MRLATRVFTTALFWAAFSLLAASPALNGVKLQERAGVRWTAASFKQRSLAPHSGRDRMKLRAA
jgi:hypothetical protein